MHSRAATTSATGSTGFAVTNILQAPAGREPTDYIPIGAGPHYFQPGVMLLCGLLSLLNGAVPARAGESGQTAATAPVDLGELSLEELLDVRIAKVYGASKFEQRVTQAPAAVTIVTADEIRKYGYRTLASVLQGIRGVYVTDDRGYSYLGMRGFSRPGDYNSRILLLVDGHKLNDDLYNSALIGTEGVIDIDLVERVEVIRGPSSSIYGASAFSGSTATTQDVITQNGRTLRFKLTCRF